MRFRTGVAGSAALAQAREILKAITKADRASTLNAGRPTSSQHYGEANQFGDIDQEKLKEALKKNEEATKIGGSKRKCNSVDAGIDVTAEEMEAYRMKKERTDDPLAKLAESEEILEYK